MTRNMEMLKFSIQVGFDNSPCSVQFSVLIIRLVRVDLDELNNILMRHGHWSAWLDLDPENG